MLCSLLLPNRMDDVFPEREDCRHEGGGVAPVIVAAFRMIFVVEYILVYGPETTGAPPPRADSCRA